jgi:hypothetical protein
MSQSFRQIASVEDDRLETDVHSAISMDAVTYYKAGRRSFSTQKKWLIFFYEVFHLYDQSICMLNSIELSVIFVSIC